MNCSELQVGNLISCEGQICRVTKIDPPYIGTDGHVAYAMAQAFKPVPTSDEWLVSFGYIKDTYDHYKSEHWEFIYEIDEYRFHRHEIVLDDEGDWFFYIDGVHFIPCNFIHQVQNAHLLLTGRYV